MGKGARLPFVTGRCYHIYNRGRSRLKIFHQPRDYADVLWNARRYTRKYQLSLIAYALLPNHFHFLVRQDGPHRAGKLPQYIFNSYSKKYNLRYRHSGTILESSYKIKHVLEDDYLRHLCRYIHANPVRHGLVHDINDWPYTNWHEWMGTRTGSLWDPNFVADYFPDRDAYREWVLEYCRRNS